MVGLDMVSPNYDEEGLYNPRILDNLHPRYFTSDIAAVFGKVQAAALHPDDYAHHLECRDCRVKAAVLQTFDPPKQWPDCMHTRRDGAGNCIACGKKLGMGERDRARRVLYGLEDLPPLPDIDGQRKDVVINGLQIPPPPDGRTKPEDRGELDPYEAGVSIHEWFGESWHSSRHTGDWIDRHENLFIFGAVAIVVAIIFSGISSIPGLDGGLGLWSTVWRVWCVVSIFAAFFAMVWGFKVLIERKLDDRFATPRKPGGITSTFAEACRPTSDVITVAKPVRKGLPIYVVKDPIYDVVTNITAAHAEARMWAKVNKGKVEKL